MRILFVTPPLGPIGSGESGGVETHLLTLAPILVERGHSVGVVAPAGSLLPVPGATLYEAAGEPSPSATRAERSAVTIMRAGGLVENMWELAFRVQESYDAIVGVSYDWLPFYLTPFFRTRVFHWISICSAIETVDRMIEQRWRDGGLRLALYTQAQTATFPFLDPARVALLYGAVDPAVFKFNLQPQGRLCWAGRISPEKGLADATAAARALNMPLDVCGAIQDEAYWGNLPKEGVTYHGFLPPAELQRRYANACAMLATPHWIEAFGNAVIEAMSCGTPVVAYNRGGPVEIIEHGQSGVLVPQGDVRGLGEGVREAMRLDRRRVAARAADFSVIRMADRFEAWIGA